jgi:hypothetical protein
LRWRGQSSEPRKGTKTWDPILAGSGEWHPQKQAIQYLGFVNNILVKMSFKQLYKPQTYQVVGQHNVQGIQLPQIL